MNNVYVRVYCNENGEYARYYNVRTIHFNFDDAIEYAIKRIKEFKPSLEPVCFMVGYSSSTLKTYEHDRSITK